MSAAAGRRMCAWCVPARDLGPAPELPAGAVTHGICAECAAKLGVEIKAHPSGGYTHARSVGGTARIYTGNWPSRRAALAAL